MKKRKGTTFKDAVKEARVARTGGRLPWMLPGVFLAYWENVKVTLHTITMTNFVQLTKGVQ